MVVKDKPTTRLYQLWKGSNRFFCGGRLIFGPDVASLFLTTFIIAAPGIVFCIRTYLKIVNQHTNHPGKWYPVLIVGFILTALDLMFLFLTSSRDPGIIPRNTSPPESDEAYDGATPSMEWVSGRTPYLRLSRTKDVMVNGHAVKVKYCDTCLLYRPPRASHCSICNNCVQRFDHHCPWVSQCIAIRNYRFFFMFISTATILCMYVFVCSWIFLLSEDDKLSKAIKHDVISDILIVYSFVAVWFVGGLTVFHLYLICTNQTTYENFRYRYDKKENPYNRGVLRNLTETFFSRIPPSMNKYRSFVEEDEHIVIGPLTPNFGEAFVSSKDKIDIEMGGKLTEVTNYSLPAILRNLSYDDDTDDDSKIKEEVGRADFDPLISGGQDANKSSEITIDVDGVRELIKDSYAGDLTSDSARSSGHIVLGFIPEDRMNESAQRSGANDGADESVQSSAANEVRESTGSSAVKDGAEGSFQSTNVRVEPNLSERTGDNGSLHQTTASQA